MRAGLLAALIALALVAGCRSNKLGSVVLDPELAALVPADTTFVVGADLDAIRTTHVFQKYLDRVPLPQLDEFSKKTGVDPRKDLSHILSCSNGKTALFFARGKLGEPKVHVEGVQRSTYKGHALFGNDQSAVLFWDNSTAVAGRTPDLRALADSGPGGSRGIPTALRDKVASLGAASQVWAAFTGGMQSLNLGFPEDSNIGQVLHILRGIDSGTVGINLRDGFGLEIHVDCRTPNDAKHVHDAVRGVIGIGRLNTPDNQPDLLKLYDAIQVKQDQTKVDVTAQIAPDLEDKFLDLWLNKR